MMNTVIDILNSSMHSKKEWKQPLSAGNQKSRAKLIEFIEKCESWFIVNPSTKQLSFMKQPCFLGLLVTARGLLKLSDDLHQEFPGFQLATRLCCQDSVENFFSKLRQRGGSNVNPTARSARLTIRHIMATKNLNASSSGNVQLENPDFVLEQQPEEQPVNEQEVREIPSENYTKKPVRGEQYEFKGSKPKNLCEKFSSISVESKDTNNTNEFQWPSYEKPDTDIDYYNFDMAESYDEELQKFKVQNEEAENTKEPETFFSSPVQCSICVESLDNTPADNKCPTVELLSDSMSLEVLDCSDFPTGLTLAANTSSHFDPEVYFNINTANKFERCSVNYLAGYSLYHTAKKHKTYLSYINSLTKKPGEVDEDDDLIKHRQFGNKNDQTKTQQLRKPTQEYREIVAVLLDFFETNWSLYWHEDKPLAKLMEEAEKSDMIRNLWLQNGEQKYYDCRKTLMRLIFLVKMFDRCKENNIKEFFDAQNQRKIAAEKRRIAAEKKKAKLQLQDNNNQATQPPCDETGQSNIEEEPLIETAAEMEARENRENEEESEQSEEIHVENEEQIEEIHLQNFKHKHEDNCRKMNNILGC